MCLPINMCQTNNYFVYVFVVHITCCSYFDFAFAMLITCYFELLCVEQFFVIYSQTNNYFVYVFVMHINCYSDFVYVFAMLITCYFELWTIVCWNFFCYLRFEGMVFCYLKVVFILRCVYDWNHCEELWSHGLGSRGIPPTILFLIYKILNFILKLRKGYYCHLI